MAARAIVLAAGLLLAAARGVDAAMPEGVLIIHSNQRPTVAALVIEDVLRKVVPDRFGRPVGLYSEYLDAESPLIGSYGATAAEFVRGKYGGRNIRIIVASAPPALQFALEFRDRMLPGVPIVHLAVPREQLARMTLPADVVGRPIDLDPTATLDLALRLNPGAKRLVIVLGAAERDRTWERRVRSAVERLGTRVEVEYVSALPTAEVLQRVSALPSGTIVFTPGYFVDGGGRIDTPYRSLELIAPASAAPVYSPLDTHIGTGVVGGYVTPYDEQARQAGAIVVRLLDGAPPAEVASSAPLARVPMVDWRQVRRWGIDERQLPVDTVVRFREPTLWDTHSREISIGVVIVLLQAALITALLFERRSRRRTAAALEDSEARMNLAARAAGLSTWIWNVARDRLQGTARSPRHAGLLNERPIDFGQVLDTVHPADREHVETTVRRALAANEEFDLEYRVVRPDGEVRWVAARGRAEHGGSERLLGVAHDVTERKAAELQAERERTALRHMSRVSMMGQLSASIAHELNQPLAAILGNAEAAQKMLARGRVDVAELEEICQDIVTEDHRAAQLIARLRALFKRGELRLVPLDVNDLIRETLDLVRTDLLTRHVTLLTDLAPSLPAIDGDRVQLQQVLMNLIANAADAMQGDAEGERKLAIRTDAIGADIRLCVIDCGIGIAAEDLKNVFDPFWSTKSEGLGMGLAICRSIVAAHHGSLTATNNPGRGATFCAVLPVRKQA